MYNIYYYNTYNALGNVPSKYSSLYKYINIADDRNHLKYYLIFTTYYGK
jgi:hypothetical protein